MENSISQIEVDTSAYIDEHGVSVCVYMGEGSCDPIVEHTFDWEQLIENHFETFVINDRIREVDVYEAGILVTKLEQMTKYARNMLDDYTQDEEE